MMRIFPPASAHPSMRIVVPALLFGFLTACGPENTYQAPPPPAVTVAPPIQKSVTSYLELTGNTQASQTAILTARVAGLLTAINVKDGSEVRKGDVLFTIEPDQYKAQLALAEATLEQNKVTLAGNELVLNRQQLLAASNSASQSALDKARTDYDTTLAAVKAAEANVRLAEISLRYTEVKAPFDGRIERRLVDVGNLVGQSSSTKLATINRITPLYVYFSLSEADVLRVRAMHRSQGSAKIATEEIPIEVGLRDGAGYPYTGRLDYIAPTISASTGTQELRGVLENADRELLAGQFVRIRVPVTTRDDVLLVPQSAVGSSQAGSYVLVLGGDNRIQSRLIKTGQSVGQLQVIESGLEAGDQVVVEGLMRALPGTEVTPRKVTLAEDGGIPGPTTAATN